MQFGLDIYYDIPYCITVRKVPHRLYFEVIKATHILAYFVNNRVSYFELKKATDISPMQLNNGVSVLKLADSYDGITQSGNLILYDV